VHRNNPADKEVSEGASFEASDEVCNSSSSREHCYNSRLFSTYSLPTFVNFMYLFQMTQAAGGIIIYY
jgi:hypothetical protein